MKVWTQDYKVDKDAIERDAHGWLTARASELGTPYLLAFADDGVIWGALKEGVLLTRGVQLVSKTLRAARLFGRQRELALWREGDGFAAHLTDDEARPPAEEDVISETYWLWGAAESTGKEFTPMVEGLQGLRHMPPIELGAKQGAGLTVRHYIAEDDQGAAFIAYSRLTGLVTVHKED
jgi:CRISPR-associated protein (TIGR03984 family)